MDLICDLIFSPLAALVAAGIFHRLPPKGRLLIASFVSAIIAGPILWFILLSPNEIHLDLEEFLKHALIENLMLGTALLVAIFAAVSYFQDRHEKHHIQDQFVIVKDLIRGHHYEQAKAVLATINHPKAREWEAKLHDQSLQDSDLLKQLQFDL
jgi:hypothetical protein